MNYGTNILSTPSQTQQGAYLDIPADKRLRPWLSLGSLLLTFMGAGMILCTFVHHADAGSLWGLLIAGIVLAFAGQVGLAATFSQRTSFTGMYFGIIMVCWLIAVAAMIVNACFLKGNAVTRCTEKGFARFSAGCEDVLEYHYIIYSVFGVLTALWVPTLVVLAGYLWRITSLYRKQEYEPILTNAVPTTTGISRM